MLPFHKFEDKAVCPHDEVNPHAILCGFREPCIKAAKLARYGGPSPSRRKGPEADMETYDFIPMSEEILVT